MVTLTISCQHSSIMYSKTADMQPHINQTTTNCTLIV